MTRLIYEDIEFDDETTSCLIRFLAVLELANDYLRTAVLVLDEEGPPHAATEAALEAAHASIVAAARAELLDPWWKDHDPPVSELTFPVTNAEVVELMWKRESEGVNG